MSDWREVKRCEQCGTAIHITIHEPHRVEMTRIVWTCAGCKFVNSK